MDSKEQILAEQLAEIQKLAAADKKVNAAALIENLFSQREQRFLPAKEKTRAYLLSIFAPPFGLYYAAKFLGRTEDDAKRVAWACLIMTAVSGLALMWMSGLIFSQTPGLQQIQNISPQQIQQTLQ